MSANGIVKWQEPARDGRSRRKNPWADIARELREHPGRWALVAEDVAPSTAVSIKSARLVAFAPAGSFEAVSRGARGRRAEIYARYVGDGGDVA